MKVKLSILFGVITCLILWVSAWAAPPSRPTPLKPVPIAVTIPKPTTTIKPTTTTTTTTINYQKVAALAAAIQRNKAEANKPKPKPQTVAPTNFGSVAAIAQCIKDHESGNYTEHSHPWDGSGAYQMIPSTWQKLWVLAGRPGDTYYEYAFQAPPAVQDAVMYWALTHSPYMHNWDPAYGNDPCTVGMH